MRALAPRFRGFPPAHRHVDEDDDDEVESRPTGRPPVVGHRGASDRLLHRARHLLDRSEALSLSDAGSIADAIRERVRNLGSGFADAVVQMWAHLYTGGPSPVGALATANADRTWRDWFEAEGLAPQGIGATHEDRSPSPFASRPALEPPSPPSTAGRAWNEIDQAWADAQARQHAVVEAWRAAQMAELRRLWADGFQEGVGAFAEQYPELLTDSLLAEWDAEDEENADQLAPHYASIGKMVGQLTNLLMLAPGAGAIGKWFDDNEHRVQSQAETLAWQAEQTGYRQAGANFGLTIEWESEGDDRVCDDCAALEEAGPYTAQDGDNPLPAFPGDGSTVCGPNCRCSLNYLEPDEPSLGQAEALDQADAGDLVDSSSEAIPGALGVEALNDLEGGSLVETFREIALRSRHRDVEIGFALDRKGRIITSALGNADSINFTEGQLAQQHGAALVVHNHPLSVSFSPTDVAFAFSQAVGEMRVVSPEWDYKLKPIGKRFVSSDAVKVINAAQEQVDQLYPVVKEKATLAYHEQFKTPGAEHLSYAEHFKRESADFWHDVWSQTAKETKLFQYERTVAPKLEQMVHVQPATVTKAHIEQANLKAIGQMPLSFPKVEQDIYQMPTGTGPKGANEGFWKEGKTGERYYVKPMSTERAANEVGAMRVYEAFGAIPGKDIPYVNVINRVDDKPVVISRYVDETLPKAATWWESPASDYARTDARRFWAVDALLSHYDVVGANPAKGFDNLIARGVNGGSAFRVEGGGAMKFSGLGAQKASWAVGAPWVEPWTMRGIAHDGIPGGATVKPVFGSISDEKASELLGQLQHVDLVALDQAWKDVGMSNVDRLNNMNVIKSRLAQIPSIQMQLGMVKGAKAGAELAAKVGTYGAPAPPAIASKVSYTKWSPKTDKYGKLLAVQHKAFFEDFKKFNPVTGKASQIVEQLAAGVTFPEYAIKQGEAKIARLKLRVAFARSYNYALGVPPIPGLTVAPAVQEFWKVKLGLVETKAVDVPHVISTWLPKAKDETPVHTIATALSKYDPINDPSANDFLAAHKNWGAMTVPQEVWKEAKELGGGSDIKGWALGYNATIENSPGFVDHYNALSGWWKQVLGDLPAQPESLQPVVKVAAHDAAVRAALATPYDPYLVKAKEAISTGADVEDVLSTLGDELFTNTDAVPNEMIAGLVKHGLAGDADSAANLVADWMAQVSEIEKPIEKGAVWLKPDADAFAQFQEDKVSGTGVPTLHDFQETYADWLAGGDQASWMPTPVTKWFDANMVKPTTATWNGLSPTELVSSLQALGVANVDNYIDHYEWLYQNGKLPSWLAGKNSELLAIQKSSWKEWFEEKGLAPESPHPVQAIAASGLNKDQQFIKGILVSPGSDYAKVEAISGHTGFSQEQANVLVKGHNLLEAESATGATDDQLVAHLLASGLVESGSKVEAEEMVAAWKELGIKVEPLPSLATDWEAEMPGEFKVWYDAWTNGLPMEGDIGPITPQSPAGQWFLSHGIPAPPDLSALETAWHEKFGAPFDPWYESWTTGKPLDGLEGPIKPDSPGGSFFVEHGVPQGNSFFETPVPVAPGVGAVSVTKVDQLYGLLKADWPSMATAFPQESFAKVIGDYQAGKTNESWTAWFQAHAPEIQVAGKDLGQKAVAAVTFTQQTTMLAWSPTNDKWAKKFGKAHPKLYNSFKVFQAKPWVAEITKDLQFPAYAQKNAVKMQRLRLKVALARTYNMALQGKYAELGALDPKLPVFWKAKLGGLGMGVEQKVVGPVDASLANLNTTKELLRTTQTSWYPDFRSTFGHTVTMKVIPEFATTDIAIPANSTRERELRALAFAKSYLMAKAGDVAGLKAIDERLLYFWDEKLGGGLVPRVAVSLQGAPWVHDYAAMYKSQEGRYGAHTTQADSKYARSTRSGDYNNFKRGVKSFTASGNQEIRESGKAILHGGIGGRYGPLAKALIEAIQDAPATAPRLIRHESWESVARRAGSTRQGLEAFLTTKVGTDYAFTMDLVSTQYEGSWQGDLKWIIEPGAKAVFAQPISSHQSENEFITAGRFKILKVGQEAGKLVVYVRQVGVFDLPD